MPLYSNVRVDSVLPIGLRSIDKAIALDSTVPEAYASRANLLALGWRWSEAERDYQRALVLDPNYATAHQWFGELLLLNGRVDEAVAQLRRATELDPLSPVAFGSYGLALGIAKRDAQAQAAARHALDLDSTLLVTRMMSGGVQLYANHVPEAVHQLEAARQLDSGKALVLGVLGYAYARAGRTAEARAIARRVWRSRSSIRFAIRRASRPWSLASGSTSDSCNSVATSGGSDRQSRDDVLHTQSPADPAPALIRGRRNACATRRVRAAARPDRRRADAVVEARARRFAHLGILAGSPRDSRRGAFR